MENYSIPQKDGWFTKYPNGTILIGTWKSRLAQYRKLTQPLQ